MQMKLVPVAFVNKKTMSCAHLFAAVSNMIHKLAKH